jgi:hypothetical protein
MAGLEVGTLVLIPTARDPAPGPGSASRGRGLAQAGTRLALHAALLAALLMGSACTAHRAGLRPFTSDGCSLFPDRSLAGSADWCACCVEHDRAYWRGGTEQERLAADQRLEQCIARTTGDAQLAATMLAGVRLGGTPYLDTPFRWAYGWPGSRNYEALTPAEARAAARMEREHRDAARADPCRP